MEINKKARQLTSDIRKSLELVQRNKEKELNNTYKLKECQLYTLTFGGILYSFWVTVLTIMNTVRFKADLKALIEGIYSTCLIIWDNVLVWANTVSETCYRIPYKVVAVVFAWIVRKLIIILVLTLIIGGITWGVYRVIRFYCLNLADKASVVVSLVSFSLVVWFGDYIGKIINCNLIFFYLIFQLIYIFIRMYLGSRGF
ncbi:MAG: hypothetical protein KIC94_01340 [Clostridiales bacterium]|nr:hypothetical protein [Clostridiales bacterium]